MTQYELLISVVHNCPYTRFSSKLPDVSVNHWCSNERDVLEISRTKSVSKARLEKEISILVRELGARIMRRLDRGSYNQIVVYRHISSSMKENVNAVIERCNCVEIAPTNYHGGAEWYRVISFNKTDANALIRVLSRFAEVRVEKFVAKARASIKDTFMISTDSIFGGMTHNQIEALKTALSGGYFDMPARSDTRRLAAARGIARTTYEVHLRKSMKKLLDSLQPYVEMETGVSE